MLELSQNAVSDQLQIGHASHPGRSGKNNEDYYGVFSVATTGGECVVATVADGIGGSVGGERASRLAVSALRNSLNDQLYLATSLGQRLDQAIRLANREIYEKSQNEPALAGMGTTVVAVALDGDRLYVAHAGDSRAYLVRGGRAHQLTLDHSWAQEAIEAGRITPEDAKTHPNRHVIRRYLGINEEVETDPRVVDPAQVGSRAGSPTTVVSPILTQAGDAIVLCSDGLTDDVNDEEIARIVSKHAPEDAARRLVDAANAAGGGDNITVVVLRRGGGKPLAAGGRSRLVAYGLAVVALLIVAALGWLIASGALFGGSDGNVVALNGTPSVAPVALATSAPETTPDLAALPAVQATATEEAIAPEQAPADVPPVTSTPISATATAELAPSLAVSAMLIPTETASTETVTVQTTITETTVTTQPPLTSTPVPGPDATNPGNAAEAMTSTMPLTPTLQQPAGTPTATIRPTSTPVVRASPPTPTVTATPAIAVRNTPVPIVSRAASVQIPTPVAVVPTLATVTVLSTDPAASEPDGPTKVTNVRPANGTNFNENDEVEFTWTAIPERLDNQVYEVAFWSPNEVIADSKSKWPASTETSFKITPKGSGMEAGPHRWTIWLRSIVPNERIRSLGTYEFIVSGSQQDEDQPEPEPAKKPTTEP